jgi:hypothetical protein
MPTYTRYEPPVADGPTKPVAFFLRSSRGTNQRAVVQVPEDWTEEQIKDEAEDWCSQFPAWTHPERSLTWGYECPPEGPGA